MPAAFVRFRHGAKFGLSPAYGLGLTVLRSRLLRSIHSQSATGMPNSLESLLSL
jgi:hypothetical protein